MKIRRPLSLLLGIFWTVNALFLAGCSEPVERDTLKIALAKEPSSELVFIALEKGFFKEEGLEMDVTTFPSGKKALEEGFLDKTQGFELVTLSDMPFVKALQDEVDLVTFANIFSADNINSIVAREGADVHDFTDLAGKTIGTQQYSAAHFFLYQIIKAYELDDKEVKLEFMPAENLPLALADGRIDAFSMSEPYVSQARELLDGRVTVLQMDGLYHQYELLASTRKILDKKSRAFEKFVRGLLKAQQFSYEQPDQAIVIVAKYLEISPQSVKNSWVEGSLKIGLQQGLLVTLEGQQRWLDLLELVSAEKNFMDYFYFPILEKVAPGSIAIIYDRVVAESFDERARSKASKNNLSSDTRVGFYD